MLRIVGSGLGVSGKQSPWATSAAWLFSETVTPLCSPGSLWTVSVGQAGERNFFASLQSWGPTTITWSANDPNVLKQHMTIRHRYSCCSHRACTHAAANLQWLVVTSLAQSVPSRKSSQLTSYRTSSTTTETRTAKDKSETDWAHSSDISLCYATFTPFTSFSRRCF